MLVKIKLYGSNFKPLARKETIGIRRHKYLDMVLDLN
jgi:hypothetical protein